MKNYSVSIFFSDGVKAFNNFSSFDSRRIYLYSNGLVGGVLNV